METGKFTVSNLRLDVMKKKKIRILLIISVIAIGVISSFVYVWYYQTYTGSRNGRVIDAITGKPIEGVVVYCIWKFSGFMAVVGESLAARYETTTDKDGHYFIPSQRCKRKNLVQGSLLPESVFIYKNNCAVYTLYREYKKPAVGRSFGYPDKNQKYHKRNCLVKLYPWKNDESHYRHIEWIKSSMSYYKSELMNKELTEEKKRADKEVLK